MKAMPIVLLILYLSILGVAFGWTPPASVSTVQTHHMHKLFSSNFQQPTSRIKAIQLYSSKQRQPSTTIDSTNKQSVEIPIIHDINDQISKLNNCLNSSNPISQEPITILKNILTSYTIFCTTKPYPTSQMKFKVSALIDTAFRIVTNEAFSAPYSLSWINLGMETLSLQLHSNEHSYNDGQFVKLQRPYDQIPKGTYIKALRALTSIEITSIKSTRSILSISKPTNNEERREWINPSNAAFRILQRLVTNKGVRTFRKKKKLSSSSDSDSQQTQHVWVEPKIQPLDERDFNMVLHSYATTSTQSYTSSNSHTAITTTTNIKNDLHSSHRVMALQERTPHAPPLSPTSYSILIKAYGLLKDYKNVQMSIQSAKFHNVVVDIILVNTVLDAYVNCDRLDKALDVFDSITSSGEGSKDSDGEKGGYWPLLTPNSRTYNTILKGMANECDIRSAMKLSKTIQGNKLWDDITTNTLVKAAVSAEELDLAESILTNHTSKTVKVREGERDHPNVEAYTELLDGYAKSNQLENALQVMSIMEKRNIKPNVYTYTCMVGALARNNKVRQGRKMLVYAAETLPSSEKDDTLAPTYNAFISGLLSDKNTESNGAMQSSHASNIVEVLAVLQEMQELNIQPNVVTVALVVDGLGKCTPPRCKEARELVQHLEFTTTKTRRRQSTNYGYSNNQGTSSEIDKAKSISLSNNKIATALISAYGREFDIDAAMDAFKRILTPDVVAFNALLDACCRCDEIQLAFLLFKKHASLDLEGGTPQRVSRSGDDEQSISIIKPDVVTFTTLISALLQLKSRAATKRAVSLYSKMKQKWWISPDTILIDTILTNMISGGPIGFEDEDIKFTLEVLRDGAHLEWDVGQYEKRRKAVRGILVGCTSEVWKRDEFAYGLVSEQQPEDVLFTKKGWNRIDSGFRLWGSYDDIMNQNEQLGDRESSVDSFLASKGWNDIDSGFRLV